MGFLTGNPNELIDLVDFGFEHVGQGEGTNDCLVKSAESYERRSGQGRTADKIRKVIGKTDDQLVTVNDMEKAGYKFKFVSDKNGAFVRMKNNQSAFHLQNHGDGTGHATLANRMQMLKSGDTGKIFYRLYTMDPASSQYTRTRISMFLFIIE